MKKVRPATFEHSLACFRTSGDYWGANFTLNMLPTVVDHLSWSTIAETQNLNTPFQVTIAAQNLTNGAASGFNGPVAVSGYMTGLVSVSSTIISNLSWGGSIGSGLTLAYAFTPNTNIQVASVRAYSGDKVSIWTDSGTLLASQAISSGGSWAEAPLATPVILSAGTTYRVGTHIPTSAWGYFATASWPATYANGTVGQNFYWSSGDVFPTMVYGTNQGPLVDLRYQVVFSNAVPVSPTSSGAFANGVWSGNITVFQATTNVLLKADDGAGHVATSNPFNVITPLRLLSPQRLAGGQFQCTVASGPGQRLEVLASTNLVIWVTIATLTNASGTITFTDATPGLNKCFYQIHQLP